jgi:hypothetical protein
VITLADAKLNIRVDEGVTFEDSLIGDLVESATAYMERRIGWHLGPLETITVIICGDGTRTLWLAQPPVVDTVSVEDADGEEVEDWEVRGSKLIRTDGGWCYGVEYTITYDAGFAPGSGPPDLLQATRLLVAGWYEHREAWATGTLVQAHKHSVDSILGRYERVRA